MAYIFTLDPLLKASILSRRTQTLGASNKPAKNESQTDKILTRYSIILRTKYKNDKYKSLP